MGVHVEVAQAGVVACDAGVLYLSGAVKQLIGFVVDDDAIEFLSVAVFQGGLVGIGAVGGDGAVADFIVAVKNRTALVGAVAGDEAVDYFAGGLIYAAAGLGAVSGNDAIVDVSGAVVDAAAGLGVVVGDGAIEDFAFAAVDGAAVNGVVIGEGGAGDVAGAAADSAAVRGLVAGEGAGEQIEPAITAVADGAAVIVGFVVFQEAVIQSCGALVIVNCAAVVSGIAFELAIVQIKCTIDISYNRAAVFIGDVIDELAIGQNRSAGDGFGPGAAVIERSIFGKSARDKFWLAGIVAADGPAEVATLIIKKHTLFDYRTGVVEENCSTDGPIDAGDFFGGSVAVDNGKADQDGIGVFAVFEVEGSMREGLGAADINDGRRYGVGVVGVAALDSDHFAVVTHVAVAGAGISARGDDDGVAVG